MSSASPSSNSSLRNLGLAAALLALLPALGACSNLDEQQQMLLSGGAVGAVVGTVSVAATGGCIPCGTAIGAVVGTAGGYLVDQLDKATKPSSSSSSSSSASNGNYTPSSGGQNYGAPVN
jgi:hypothetical protein